MANKKIRFYIWIVQGYLKKHWLRGLLTVAVIGGIIAASISLVPQVVRSQEQIFTEGIVGKYTLKQLPPQVLEYLSYGLVEVDDQGNPQPLAAQSVEADATGKVFTVKLKSGIKWQNGSDLTSNDLAYNLADVAIERPDNQTLIFTLKDSFAPFPTLLTAPLLKVTSSDEIYGIGQYRIARVEYRQTQYLTSLELESTTQKPNKLVIRFYPSEEEAVTALKLGQISGVQLSHIDMLKGWNNTTIYEKPIQRRFVGVFLNMSDPIVGGKDSTFRRALSLAIPDVPGKQPFYGPFPINSWAYTSIETKYRNDPNKALEIFNKYKETVKSDTPLSITLSTSAVYQDIAQYIAQSWEQIGVKTTISINEKKPDQFQALLIAQELPSDPDQYSLWHSTQKISNITKYSNARVDKDLEDGRKSIDKKVRQEKYADFQKQLTEDVPVVYLYQPYTSYAILNKYNRSEILELKKFK